MISQPEAQNPKVTPQEASEKLSQTIMSSLRTQMICVAARLSIADLLKDGPQSVEALARAAGTDAPSLYRLLRALAGMGIFVEDEQGRFELTPLAEPLRARVPGSWRAEALVFGEPSRWRAWGDLLYSVTTGKSALRHINGMTFWENLANNPKLSANFDDAAILQANPQLRGILCDPSRVISGAGPVLEAAGLKDRREVLPSDFFEAVPE